MGPVADTSANSRRTLAFIIVVAVHVVLIWGFNAGLTDIMVEKVLGPMTTDIIEEKKVEEDKPPPPPPKLETPPPYVPPPDISIEAPPVENSTAIQSAVTTQLPVAAPPPAPVARAPVDVAPRQNPRRPLPPADDFYPPAARRAGEEGSVDVQMTVLEDGKVTNPKVLTPSKFPRLDEAALKYVSTWRLLPGTRDGKPTAMQHSVRVTFKLKD